MARIKLLSWNVNGLRAAKKKGSLAYALESGYDIVCLQETKISGLEQIDEQMINPDGYQSVWDLSTEKKGYSGVVTYSRIKIKKDKTDFGNNLLSREGRVIETDFGDFVLLNIYFPNGGASAERLRYKLEFYKQFLTYLKKLKAAGRKVVFCGDLNTAHQEIDLARPKENEKHSGFMPVEREWLDKIEEAGFIDTFRLLNPESKQYSWWDQKTYARERNVGWRIDYFWVSENLRPRVKEAFILDSVEGSDHAPVGLVLEL